MRNMLHLLTNTDKLSFIGPVTDNSQWILQKFTIVWIINFRIDFNVITKYFGFDAMAFELFSKVYVHQIYYRPIATTPYNAAQ